jgi:hypothetical protein
MLKEGGRDRQWCREPITIGGGALIHVCGVGCRVLFVGGAVMWVLVAVWGWCGWCSLSFVVNACGWWWVVVSVALGGHRRLCPFMGGSGWS